MKVINIMADGTTRTSMKGVVIKSPEFYKVLKSIKEKQK